MRIYIAGPMTGYRDFNYPAFEAAARALAAVGHEPVSPTEGGQVDGWQWSDYMRRGISQLIGCDAIALLPGWDESRGARIEQRLATDLGMESHNLNQWIAIATTGTRENIITRMVFSEGEGQ